MGLNRMTHRGGRGSHVGVRGSHYCTADSQSAEGLAVVGIVPGAQLPADVGIHRSQSVGRFLRSVTQVGRRRLR